MKRECDEEDFLSDSKDHLMTVVKDDGVHRFIRFKKESSNTYWFDLITWPGFLCISGDYGTYVFSRLNDMFEFFRMDDNDFNKKKDKLLNINPSYWGEKLEATDRGGYINFDSDVFAERVKEYFDNHMAEDIEDDDLKNELWESIEDQVISNSYDCGHRAYDAVYNFRFTSSDGEKFEFIDFFDSGSTETYSFHYLWCLYAIVWGIKKYDEREIAK